MTTLAELEARIKVLEDMLLPKSPPIVQDEGDEGEEKHPSKHEDKQ